MEPTDITIEVLKEIRDEMKGMRAGLDQTNARLDQTNERLDQTNERLDNLHRRQVETEIRLATELGEVTAAVQELTTLFRNSLTQTARLDDHERRIAQLEEAQLERG